ncbi:hypothetical protein BDN71DRAFT_1428230 [Pleurotus eryngii]|uniref:Uncharacterized protein n=1 Tax=Pleurotus eryngii TaxID=5323 RepID=A0A9P6A8P5_PLEER|nr:hypothetical protein BDN71DRAFT_1428230 [Pleurotus eryngii]
MQTAAVDLTVLSELIQQLALAQAANQAAGANGGALAAPTASAVLALNTAPAPVAANPTQAAADVDAAPFASTPAGYVRCSNCNILHPLAVVGPATLAVGVPTIPATPIAGLSTPATPVAGASNANNSGTWYAVTRGRQVGVFRGW